MKRNGNAFETWKLTPRMVTCEEDGEMLCENSTAYRTEGPRRGVGVRVWCITTPCFADTPNNALYT